jgi:hypothetical protein
MNTETAPVAEVENTATDLPETEETAQAETPETDAEASPQESEKDWREAALKRAERRINKKHAEAAQERARADLLAERLAKYETQQTAEKVEVDPRDYETRVRAEAKEIARMERVNEQCTAIADEGAKKFPGFREAIASVAQDMPLFDRGGKPTAAMEVVLEADKPAALLSWLGKNPDVVADLADLTPTQLSRRLDRIERDMAAAPKTSAAPKPLEAVASRSVPSLSYSPEMTDAQYRKWREAQRAKK